MRGIGSTHSVPTPRNSLLRSALLFQSRRRRRLEFLRRVAGRHLRASTKKLWDRWRGRAATWRKAREESAARLIQSRLRGLLVRRKISLQKAALKQEQQKQQKTERLSRAAEILGSISRRRTIHLFMLALLQLSRDQTPTRLMMQTSCIEEKAARPQQVCTKLLSPGDDAKEQKKALLSHCEGAVKLSRTLRKRLLSSVFTRVAAGLRRQKAVLAMAGSIGGLLRKVFVRLRLAEYNSQICEGSGCSYSNGRTTAVPRLDLGEAMLPPSDFQSASERAMSTRSDIVSVHSRHPSIRFECHSMLREMTLRKTGTSAELEREQAAAHIQRTYKRWNFRKFLRSSFQSVAETDDQRKNQSDRCVPF